MGETVGPEPQYERFADEFLGVARAGFFNAHYDRPACLPGDFRVHDLADPISWLPDDWVDLVLFALAIEYVNDRVAALRVLRPGGALVFSRLHPTGDWLRHGAWQEGWEYRLT